MFIEEPVAMEDSFLSVTQLKLFLPWTNVALNVRLAFAAQELWELILTRLATMADGEVIEIPN